VNQGRERERRKIMKRNQDPINRFIASKWSLLPLPKTRNINEKSMEESEERRRRQQKHEKERKSQWLTFPFSSWISAHSFQALIINFGSLREL
jgi:hypothetical protein